MKIRIAPKANILKRILTVRLSKKSVYGSNKVITQQNVVLWCLLFLNSKINEFVIYQRKIKKSFLDYEFAT